MPDVGFFCVAMENDFPLSPGGSGRHGGRTDRMLRPPPPRRRTKEACMGTVYMPRPAIPFKRDNIPKLTAGSDVIQAKFAANSAVLLNPPVSPTTFETQITDLKTKHLATKTNKAAVPARDASADVVWA